MFSASLGRRSDRLLDEFDGLFAPSPRAMSDMRDIAGAFSHRTALILSQDPLFILGLYRPPRDPPRTISGALLVPTFYLHGFSTRSPDPDGTVVMRRRPQTASCISPSRAITFSASLGRRSDRLLDEFDELFAPSPRAMSDMRHFASKLLQVVALAFKATARSNAIVILCQHRLPRDPPRTISGALLVPTFHLHGAPSAPASWCPPLG
ncbi:hypothetical protein AURDEDRAFT_160995 [Auricularia subglabra TFB-10046 SS5]|nr:hypothetical protein AURDEDRAFT_160995 [Auricularia subglabra TFB-10046 SS5]